MDDAPGAWVAGVVAKSEEAGPAVPAHRAAGRNLGLDGMRALAIVLVLISHWSNNIPFWFGRKAPQAVFFAGEIGVCLFFALSGFLIGRILLDIAARQPTWRNLRIFLVRRWMRTLPLYFAVFVVQALLWPPLDHRHRTLLAFATMTQNIATPMPENNWYPVTWSLTIEEWFYLLFGTAAIAAALWLRSRRAVWLPLGLFLLAPLAYRFLSPAFADFGTHVQKEVFYRVDGIAWGVLMAALWTRRSWLFRYPLLPFGVGVYLIVGLWTSSFRLPGEYFAASVYSILNVACALCIPGALWLRSAPSWIAAPVRRLSAYSYGLYLVHFPVLVDFAQGLWWRHAISARTATVLAVTLPFLLAWASFSFFESPILARRPPQILPPRAA